RIVGADTIHNGLSLVGNLDTLDVLFKGGQRLLGAKGSTLRATKVLQDRVLHAVLSGGPLEADAVLLGQGAEVSNGVLLQESVGLLTRLGGLEVWRQLLRGNGPQLSASAHFLAQ